MSNKDDLTYKQLSLSGFPFQIRIETEVASTENRHNWRVLTREQAWRNPETDTSGFIDIILQHNQMTTLRMVVECKRQRANDARSLQWLFLLSEREDIKRDAVKFSQ